MNRWSTEDFGGSENALHDAIMVDTHHYCCLVSKLCLWHPGTAARQASLSFTISQSLRKIMSIVLVMPSNHLILCHPLLLLPSVFPRIRVFSSESARGQSIGASASASVLPVNIQGWFPLGLTALLSLLFQGLSRVFSSATVRKCQSFGAQPSLRFNSYTHTWLLEIP